MIASVVFLLAPFAAYLPAEELHVSGVLAAVSAGLLLSRRSTGFIDSETRVLGSSVWRLLTFVLNAFAFLLIGIELPVIVETLVPHVRDYVLYGLLVSATVIVVRFAWVFPATYLPRLVRRLFGARDSIPAVAGSHRRVVGGHARHRLACDRARAALHARRPAVPSAQRHDLLHVLRDLRDARVAGPHASAAYRDGSALPKRAAAASARRGCAYAHSKPASRVCTRSKRDAVRRSSATSPVASSKSTSSASTCCAARPTKDEAVEATESRLDRALQNEALTAERRAITAMRSAGEIPDDIYRSIEYDLDLATLRLS